MSGMMRTQPARRARRGMTLVEIMISLVLLGIISGVIMRVITRQQRFYHGANQIMTQRSQLRQATSVLPVDLRSLSSVGNDIIAATDSSIDFRMNVATGIICEIVDANTIALPPTKLANGQTLTSFFGNDSLLSSAGGYEVHVYNDSNTVGNEEDYWKEYALASDVTADAGRCLTSFADIIDAGQKRFVFRLSDPLGHSDPVLGGSLSQYIQVGAPVRVLRKVRYALYQDTDGKWYLGFAKWDAASSAFESLAPVSGPYDPYGTAAGVGFRYFDVDGLEIASGAGASDRARIARIDLIARARTEANVRADGIQAGVSQQYRDSLAVSVMLRNRQ